MSLIDKFLKKKGITEFSELSQEEKDTYRKWEEILTGRKLTDEDVAMFLQRELDETVIKLINEDKGTRVDIFLKMKLEFIKKIQTLLNSPAVEKKMLEENIKGIMEQS